MSATVGEAVVKIVADAKGFRRQLNTDVDKPLQDTARTATDLFARLGVGVALTKFLSDARKNAVDLREEITKNAVVFGGAGESIRAFARTGAQALGLAEVEVMKATGTFGNLFRTMQVGEEDSANMSRTLTSLAVDMASFNNVTVDDALIALRAGLVGEVEPLRRLGVQMNETVLKTKAAEMGLGSFTGTLPPAIRMQAAYAVILEQTTLQQGDFNRTSDQAANQQRILAAQYKELATMVGNVLLPGYTAFLRFLTGSFMPGLMMLVTTVAPAVSAAFAQMHTAAGPFLDLMARFVDANPAPVFAALATVLAGLLAASVNAVIPIVLRLGAALWVLFGIPGLIAAAVGVLIGALIYAYQHFEWFRGAVDRVVDVFQSLYAAFQEGGLGGLFQRLGEMVRHAGDLIWAAAQEWGPRLWQAVQTLVPIMWGWVVDAVPKVISAVWDLLQAVGRWIAGTGAPWLAVQMLNLASALWTWVSTGARNLWSALGNLLSEIGVWILGTALPSIRTNVSSWASAFGDWVREVSVTLIPNLIELLGTIGGWILGDALPWLVTHLGQWALAFALWVPQAVIWLFEQLWVLQIRVMAWIAQQVPGLVATLAEWGWAFVQWLPGALVDLLQGLNSMIGAIQGWAFEALAAIVRWGIDFAANIQDAMVRAIANLLLGLAEGMAKIGAWVLTIPGTIWNGIVAISAQLVSFGVTIVQEIVKGIASIGQAIWDAVMEHIPTPGDVADRVGGALSSVAGAVIPGASLIGAGAVGGVRSGPTLVGELGPEIVNLGSTARVMTNQDSRQLIRDSQDTSDAIAFYGPVTFGADTSSAMADLRWEQEKRRIGRLAPA